MWMEKSTQCDLNVSHIATNFVLGMDSSGCFWAKTSTRCTDIQKNLPMYITHVHTNRFNEHIPRKCTHMPNKIIRTRNSVCTDIPTRNCADIHVFGISVQHVVVSSNLFLGLSVWRCRTVHYGRFCRMRGPTRRGSRVSQRSAGVTAGRGYCRKGSIDVNGEINTMWSQCVSHSY